MADLKMVSKWIWDGEILENVYYFVPDGGGAADWVLLAAEWLEAMYTPVLGEIVETYDNVDNEIFQWNGTDWDLIGSFTSSITGTYTAANILPRQMAVVLIGKTAVHRCQGRKFMGAIRGDHQEGGQMDTTSRGLWDEMCDIWTSPYTGTAHGLNPGVFHAATSAIVPFNGRRTNQILGTQRKRKHGVGI